MLRRAVARCAGGAALQLQADPSLKSSEMAAALRGDSVRID